MVPQSDISKESIMRMVQRTVDYLLKSLDSFLMPKIVRRIARLAFLRHSIPPSVFLEDFTLYKNIEMQTRFWQTI